MPEPEAPCPHETLGMRVMPYRNWRGNLTPEGASVEGPEDDIEVADYSVFCLECRNHIQDGITVPTMEDYMKARYPHGDA